MLKSRVACYILVIVFCLAISFTVQAEEGKYGGTLTIAAAKDAYTLDPGKMNDIPSTLVCDQIYDTLVAFDQELNIVPHVAESWKNDETGLIWTFKIRKGIKFHDGVELTAKDVAFSFQRILDSPEAASQKKSKIAMIERIETPDNYTVVFYLNMRYAPFVGAARQHIVPKHAVEAMGEEEFGRNPIGSGPFKFVEWQRDQKIVLESNRNYWVTRPYLDKLIFKPIPDGTVATMSVLTGEVDVIEEVLGQMVPKLNNSKDVDILTADGMNYYWVGFRQYDKPYNDVRFRKMVYHSIDMDKAIERIFENGIGTRAYGPVPSGLWPRDLDYMKEASLKYDKEKAKQLFEELIKDGVMERDTPIYVRVNEDPTRVKIGEVITTGLQEIGVNVKFQVIEWSAYLDWVLRSTEPGIYMLGTTPSIDDPDAIFHWLFSTEGHHGHLILGLQKHIADPWILEARQSMDKEKREELYLKTLHWAMIEQVLHIPGYHRNHVIAVRKHVHNLKPSPNGQWFICTPFVNVWVE